MAAPMCRIQESERGVGEHGASVDLFAKTRLCKFYPKGRCTKGRACTFAHGKEQLQQQPDLFRTTLCLDFLKTGACPVGSRCKFAHAQEELRAAKVPARPPSAVQQPQIRGPESTARQVLTLPEAECRAISGRVQAPKSWPGAHRGGVPKAIDEALDLLREDTPKDEALPTFDWSRQSTEEGAASVACVDFEDSDWEDEPTTPAAGAAAVELPQALPKDVLVAGADGVVSEEAKRLALEGGLRLLVRGTFIDIEYAQATPSARRARSVPAVATRLRS